MLVSAYGILAIAIIAQISPNAEIQIAGEPPSVIFTVENDDFGHTRGFAGRRVFLTTMDDRKPIWVVVPIAKTNEAWELGIEKDSGSCPQILTVLEDLATALDVRPALQTSPQISSNNPPPPGRILHRRYHVWSRANQVPDGPVDAEVSYSSIGGPIGTAVETAIAQASVCWENQTP